MIAVRAIFSILEPFLDHIFRARFDHFWSHFFPPYSLQFGPLLVAILEHLLEHHRPNSEARLDKKHDQTLKSSKKHSFKNLKKPSVFHGFWNQKPPKRASRNQRSLPRNAKIAQKNPQKTTQNGPLKLINCSLK